MKYLVTDNVLTISLEGRIDSNNASLVESELFEILKNEHKELVLDFDNVNYVSSAGLRVILKVKKAENSLKLINVSSEVYEIFEMTGFTEMIDIEKAYRKLSIDGCEIIGQGATGIVYRLNPDTIIKVYINPESFDDIKRERELARRAFIMGIPTAIPYDVVKVGKNYGSVFELLNASSFSQLIANHEKPVDEVIVMFAELLKKIHSTVVNTSELPSAKQEVLKWVSDLKPYLSSYHYDKVYNLINNVRDDHNLLHGDYHTKNVMYQNGEALLIDMDTLSYGNPIFEFGAMYNAFLGFHFLDANDAEPFLGIDKATSDKLFFDTLKLYFGTEDESFIADILKKATLVGDVRLVRRVYHHMDIESPEGKRALEHYKTEFENLIEELDSIEI